MVCQWAATAAAAAAAAATVAVVAQRLGTAASVDCCSIARQCWQAGGKWRRSVNEKETICTGWTALP